MVPSQQRLEPRDRPVLQPHDRLVGDPDLAAIDRPPEIAVEAGAVVAPLLAHSGVEGHDLIAAQAFRVGQRELRALQELVPLRRHGRVVPRDPDRAGQEDLALRIGDRRRDGLADEVGQRVDPLLCALGQDDRRELVARDPRQRVLGPEQAADPAR